MSLSVCKVYILTMEKKVMGILNTEKLGRPVVISGVTSKWNQIYNSNLKGAGGT